MSQQQPSGAPERRGMPVLGLGTWENDDAEQCAESVRTALETGYRHIDTAQIYDNEEKVGQGLRDSGVDRDEVFLTTKIWRSNVAPADMRTSTEESLRRLGVDPGGSAAHPLARGAGAAPEAARYAR